MPSDQNFNYYSAHDFHSNCDIVECSADLQPFSTLHFNIRSLAANYDHFIHMLTELYFPFSVIGLSETKIKVDQDILSNIEMPGYDFISQPTLSNAGGVGFYVNKDLNYIVCSDLTVSVANYEALSIEVHFNAQQFSFVEFYIDTQMEILIDLWSIST